MMRRLITILISYLAAWPAFAQAPPAATTLLTRIAFGSCAFQERPQPIWDSIAAYKPDLFIFGGDNVYGDRLDGQTVKDKALLRKSLATAYARAAAIPQFAAFRAKTPHLATWDDHDYGRNDASADYEHKTYSKAQFVEFWKLPKDDPRHGRAGVYHAITSGTPGRRVQVIMLDTRFFRSAFKKDAARKAEGRGGYAPDASAGKTMLGAQQWAWLEQELKKPADLRLIVSSTQVLAEDNHNERWGQLPRERMKLYELIRSTKAGRVIFLTGDRHFGALYRETKSTPYPFFEITSSGITEISRSNEAGPNRIGDLYKAENFGTVDIDWEAKSLKFAVRGMNSEAVRVRNIAFSEITPAP